MIFKRQIILANVPAYNVIGTISKRIVIKRVNKKSPPHLSDVGGAHGKPHASPTMSEIVKGKPIIAKLTVFCQAEHFGICHSNFLAFVERKSAYDAG